jgi:hypothetical protein
MARLSALLPASRQTTIIELNCANNSHCMLPFTARYFSKTVAVNFLLAFNSLHALNCLMNIVTRAVEIRSLRKRSTITFLINQLHLVRPQSMHAIDANRQPSFCQVEFKSINHAAILIMGYINAFINRRSEIKTLQSIRNKQ